jgi:DNA invertase Pin-like site-specific DNA recombinase
LALTALATVAETKRDLILERRREGIARAKAEGRCMGRTPTARRLSDEISRLKAEGMKPTDIAERLRIGRASVYRVLRGAVAAVG